MRFNFKMMAAMALAFSAAGLGGALAQTQADQMKMVYQAARNQLGVLEFCQAKGYVDADTVAIQQKLLAMMPPGDAAAGDAAEALGKKGSVSAMGVNQDLETAAKAQGCTIEKLCQTMGSAIKQAGAALPK